MRLPELPTGGDDVARPRPGHFMTIEKTSKSDYTEWPLGESRASRSYAAEMKFDLAGVAQHVEVA